MAKRTPPPPPAQSPAPPQPAPLPVASAAFNRLVQAAKDRFALYDLQDRVEQEAAARPRDPQARRAAEALHESRLVAFAQLLGSSKFWQFDAAGSSCNALVHLRSRPFIALVRRLVANGRGLPHAAEYLAWFGDPADAPRVRKLLASKDWAVRDAAARGVELGVHHKYIPRPAGRTFAQLFTAALCGEERIPRGEAAGNALHALAGAAMDIDPRGTTALFRSPRALTPTNAAVRTVLLHLESIRRHTPRLHKPLPASLLWPIFDAVDRGTLKPVTPIPNTREARDACLSDILRFTVETDPIRTRRECDRILARPAGKPGANFLREAAKEILKACRGVPDPGIALAAFRDRPAKFPPAAARILRVVELLEHIASDGFELYFHNLGEHGRAAEQGLRAIGRADDAGLLKQACDLFEHAGPVKTSRDAKHAFESLTKQAQSTLAKLGARIERNHNAILAAVEARMTADPKPFRVRAAAKAGR